MTDPVMEQRIETLEKKVAELDKQLSANNQIVHGFLINEDKIITALELLTEKVSFLWARRPRKA